MAVSTNEENVKLGQKGSYGLTWPNFGILGPLISPERYKLETSNLPQRWTAVSTNEKNAKIDQKVSRGVFLFLEPP